MSEYKIVDDFQVNTIRVLVLDRAYKNHPRENGAYIDGVKYEYILNSVSTWLTLPGVNKLFKGKTVVFK